MKLDAVRRRTTIGDGVGALVRAELGRRGQTHGETSATWSDRRGQPGEGRRAKVFARIAVDDETWAEFKAIAAGTGLTVARAAGLLVTRAEA